MLKDLVWLLYITIVEILRPIYNAVFGAHVKDVYGKTVLITGTARGLGRELAVQFSKLGSTVICVDINSDDNEETLKLLDDSKCRAYTCDVSSYESVAQLHEDVRKDFGHVDILVNNAGVVAPMPFFEGSNEFVRKIVEVNILAHVWMMREFVPEMIQKKCGHIVAISSLAGLWPTPLLTVYSATKHAVIGLMGAFFKELGEKSRYIKTTVVCPYIMETPIAAISLQRGGRKFSVIPIDVAAREIIQGIREEKGLFTVPKWTGPVLHFARLVPFNIQTQWGKFIFGKRVNSGGETTKHIEEAYRLK